MSTITTRSGKGAPLTNNEVDSNFTNLNTDKAELSGATFTGDVKLGDNDKATFGASDDLQIYHDPSGPSSVISDQGAGDLILRGSNQIRFQDATGAEHYAIFNENGAVQLYYDNAVKLATTSTGIDVTGTATMDGLTVDGAATILTLQGAGTNYLAQKFSNTGGNTYFGISNSVGAGFLSGAGNYATALLTESATNLAFGTNNVKRQLISSNGDISFYEDTGTTAAFFWDASAESLCLGNTAAGAKLDIRQDSGFAIRLEDNNGYYFRVAAGGATEIGGNLDVTGTATMDGLVVQTGAGTLTTSAFGGGSVEVASNGAYKHSSDLSSGYHLFEVNSLPVAKFNNGGDISFYEDTGTTAKLFWDASAESLMLNASTRVGTEILTVNGTVTTGGGTASAPALAFRADSSTGIFRPASQSVGVSTNGSERMRIDSAGRVGIGTSSPSEPLTILSAQDYQITAAYNATNSTSYGYYGIKNNNTGNPFYFHVGGAERMRIDSAGNVGIGTSLPNANLAVNSSNSTSGTKVSVNVQSTDVLDTNNASFSLYELGTEYGRFQRARDGAGTVKLTALGTQHLSLETLGAGNMYFRTSNTERMRIDSTGNVGIGESSPSSFGTLVVSASNPFVVAKSTSTSNAGFSMLVNSGSGGVGAISTDNGGHMTFDTGANGAGQAERMRIDSSGNLLVGRTSTTISNLGVTIPSSGAIQATANFNALGLNRLSGDGDIAIFQKSGTTVGSIGTGGGDLNIGTGDTRIRFNDATDNLIPLNAGNGYRDASISLGDSGARFKDLYLSGGVYLGGTGAANKLDDYEEGTWTPTFIGSTSGTMAVTNVVTSKYVKVGTLVTLSVYCTCNGTTNDLSGAVQITSLPFTAVSEMGVGVSPYSGLFTNNDAVFVRALGSSLRLVKGSSKANYTDGDVLTNSTVLPFMITVSYHTN